MNIPRYSEKALLACALILSVAACKSNEPKPEPQVEATAATQTAQSTATTVQSTTTGAAESTTATTPCADKAGADKGSKEKSAKSKTSKEKTAKTAKDKSAKDKAAAAKDDNVACKDDAAPAAARPKVEESPEKPVAARSESTRKEEGYNLANNKPVTDSTKVQAGEGTKVKGINDWEGEISGIPAANSKFTKLKIGMPMQQVHDLVGQPTDQGAYITGKAFIPFYFGSDRSRWEAVYKGQGRLIFANQAGFGTGQYLVWIIHNSNEGGYR